MSRKLIFVGLFLILFSLVAGTAAAAPAEAPAKGGGPGPITLPFPIELKYSEDGSWTMGVFGMPVTINSDWLNAITAELGYYIPEASPEQMSWFMAHNIQHVVIVTDMGWVRIWLNGQLLPELEVSQAAIDVVEAMYPAENDITAKLVELALRLQGTVYITFPLADGAAEFPLPRITEALVLDSNPAVNTIEVGATVAPDGRVVSIAGFTAEELAQLGMPVGSVPAELMAVFGEAGNARVNVSPGGANLLIGELVIARISWNEEARATAFGLASKLGYPEPGIPMTEELLGNTVTSVSLFVADEPQETLPWVVLQQPVNLDVAEDGSWSIAGIKLTDFGVTVFPTDVVVSAMTSNIQHLQACWNGKELRWMVNGNPLPIVSASSGWLPEAIELTGYAPLPLVQKLETALARTGASVNVSFPVTAGVQDIELGESCGYEPASSPTALSVIGHATLTRDGTLSLDGIEVPGMASVAIPATIEMPWLTSYIPVEVTQVAVGVGPVGASVEVDGVALHASWDPTILEGIASVADGFGYGVAVRRAAGVVTMAEIGAVVTITEPAPEPLAPAEIAETAEALVQHMTKAEEQVTELTGRVEAVEAAIGELTSKAVEPTAQAAQTYTVVAGDNLWTIWKSLGSPGEWTTDDGAGWKDLIMATNGLEYNEAGIVVIQPGQILTLPSAPLAGP